MIGVVGIIGFLSGLAVAAWFRPKSAKVLPLEPAQPSWTGVSLQRGDAKSINAEWQRQIFREMAKNRFFEIRY